jgi:hypothetical protein
LNSTRLGCTELRLACFALLGSFQLGSTPLD